MIQIKVNYVYETILLLLKRKMHQRKIAKHLKTSLTRIQSILNELRDINAVDYEKIGKNHVYFIKKNLISKSVILNAENYKLMKLLRTHHTLEHLFKEIVEKYPSKMIILFGSYAKFTSQDNSDIDIYVRTTNKNIKRDIQSINDSISVKIGNFNLNDLLVKEIIENHVIIQGGEEFYERIRFFK